MNFLHGEKYSIVELHVPSIGLSLNNGIPGMELFNVFRPDNKRYQHAKKIKDVWLSDEKVLTIQRNYGRQVTLKQMLHSLESAKK